MNIIERLLKTGATVKDATVGRSEADDVLDEFADKEKRTREEQAERIARERRENEAYRARNRTRVQDFLKRGDTTMTKVNAHVLGLMSALGDMKNLLAECAVGVPFEESTDLEAVFGVPTDFAEKVQAAIIQAAPHTDWHSGRPKLKGPQTLRLPHFPTAPPDNFTGTWDPVRGESIYNDAER